MRKMIVLLFVLMAGLVNAQTFNRCTTYKMDDPDMYKNATVYEQIINVNINESSKTLTITSQDLYFQFVIDRISVVEDEGCRRFEIHDGKQSTYIKVDVDWIMLVYQINGYTYKYIIEK